MKRLPEHVAFDGEDHESIATVDFDYAAIDRETSAPDAMLIASESIKVLLQWIWGDRRKDRRFRAALRRFVAFSAILHPELVGNLGYLEIGTELGCTKSNLSKIGVLFSKRFGDLHFRRQHNGQGHMRSAALRAHRRRRLQELAGQTQRRD